MVFHTIDKAKPIVINGFGVVLYQQRYIMSNFSPKKNNCDNCRIHDQSGIMVQDIAIYIQFENVYFLYYLVIVHMPEVPQ